MKSKNTSFFVLFSLFSLGFRERLLVDTRDSANIYAINILDSDLPRVKSVLSGVEIYSVIRSRISRINGRTLEEHLGNANPTGEFTREFNITTNTLSFRILRGHSELAADEVSVDDEFSRQLHIDIGDTIEFALSGKRFTMRVTNIRESVREGFRPFFYFSFSAEAFKTAPKTYFISAYTPDIESWKKMILANTDPHVTFLDIENILQIARDISFRILSVISLFLIAVSIFGILAIFSLFSRLTAIESTKQRLYSLFGSSPQSTRVSFLTTRYVILGISYILSLSIGLGLWMYVLSSTTLLIFQFSSFVLTAVVMFIVYVCLALVIRPRLDTTL